MPHRCHSCSFSRTPPQAVDARKAAVDEVERLLQHPEDLKRLPNMLEEYSAKHAANKAQLSATVGSQVDAARAGMELLEGAQKTLAKMQACYRVRALHSLDLCCPAQACLAHELALVSLGCLLLCGGCMLESTLHAGVWA